MEDALFLEFKRDLFLAILDEERDRLTADAGLIERIEAEVRERLG